MCVCVGTPVWQTWHHFESLKSWVLLRQNDWKSPLLRYILRMKFGKWRNFIPSVTPPAATELSLSAPPIFLPLGTSGPFLSSFAFPPFCHCTFCHVLWNSPCFFKERAYALARLHSMRTQSQAFRFSGEKSDRESTGTFNGSVLFPTKSNTVSNHSECFSICSKVSASCTASGCPECLPTFECKWERREALWPGKTVVFALSRCS